MDNALECITELLNDLHFIKQQTFPTFAPWEENKPTKSFLKM